MGLSVFPSKTCCIEIHQGSFIMLIMVKSSKGALNDVLMAVRRRIISEVLYCTSTALIPSTLHWDEVPFRWKRKWSVCLCVYSSEHARNLQSHSERRRGNTLEAQCRKMDFLATAIISRGLACFSTAGLVGSPWSSSRLVSHHQPKSGWSC